MLLGLAQSFLFQPAVQAVIGATPYRLARRFTMVKIAFNTPTAAQKRGGTARSGGIRKPHGPSSKVEIPITL